MSSGRRGEVQWDDGGAKQRQRRSKGGSGGSMAMAAVLGQRWWLV